MKHLRFSTYSNNKLQTVTGQDLFSNKRVLICSLLRPYELLAEQYIQRLQDDIQHYKQHGIDEVYLVNSCDGKLVLSILQSKWPNIPSLYDHDMQFVAALAKHQQKTHSLDFLSKYWNYQVLINDGAIEKFYGQPTEDYVKNLFKAGYGRLVMKLDWLYGSDENLTIWKPTSRRDEHAWDRFGIVYYYNLCPNLKLKEYLTNS